MCGHALVQEGASDLGIGRAFGEFEADVLFVDQRTAERLALLHVVDGDRHGQLDGRHRSDPDDQPLLRELAHHQREPGTFLAEEVAGGCHDIVEEEFVRVRAVLADLVQWAAAAEAGRVGLDDDQRDPLRTLGRVGGAGHHDEVCAAAVGDEDLGAVDPPSVAGAFGPSPDRLQVRAGRGLGHRQRPDELTGGHFRQPAVALFLGSVLVDVVGDNPAVHRIAPRSVTMACVCLLDRRLVQEAAAATAVLHRDARAEQAEFAALEPEVPLDVALRLPPLPVGRDLAIEERGGHREQLCCVSGHPRSQRRVDHQISFLVGPRAGAHRRSITDAVPRPPPQHIVISP